MAVNGEPSIRCTSWSGQALTVAAFFERDSGVAMNESTTEAPPEQHSTIRNLGSVAGAPARGAWASAWLAYSEPPSAAPIWARRLRRVQ